MTQHIYKSYLKWNNQKKFITEILEWYIWQVLLFFFRTPGGNLPYTWLTGVELVDPEEQK